MEIMQAGALSMTATVIQLTLPASCLSTFKKAIRNKTFSICLLSKLTTINL